MSTRFVMTPASFGATHVATSLHEIVRLVAHLHAVHVSRRELADLAPRLLEDIGVSPRQALSEAGRAPWDIQPAGPRRRGSGHGWGGDGKLIAFWTDFRAALRRWRTRQRISQLDQHALRYIGVTYAEAEREANKGFWQR